MFKHFLEKTMNGTGGHTHLKSKQHEEKHTRTGDGMATDEVKVQSHSDY